MATEVVQKVKAPPSPAKVGLKNAVILAIAIGIFLLLGQTKQVSLAVQFSLGRGCWIPSRVVRRSRTAHSVDVCDERNLWYDKVKKLVHKTFQAKGIEIKKGGVHRGC